MLRYTSAKQIPIEEFETPFGKSLDKENRWIKLSKLLPWDELVSIYSRAMSIDQGRPCIDPRVVIGSLIIKHRNKLSDEETLEQIKENPYEQYFIGLKQYRTEKIFDSSLFVTLRRRMGEDKFNEMNDRLISQYETITKGSIESKASKSKVEDESIKKSEKKESEKLKSSKESSMIKEAESGIKEKRKKYKLIQLN
jgi:Transposase domain (DUF772).